MIKKLLLLLTFSLPLLMQAQVTISVQLPPAGMIQKDQLWNLVLVNNTNTTLDASIGLNLQDALTGQTVLSAGTRSMLLGKGAKMLTVKDVQPVQYNYGIAGFSNNYLPLGFYIACYTINRNGTKGLETLTNECVRVNISPLSPPLLNTPANESVLRTTVPQLTWMPPAPLDMFDNLNYEISVAEVQDGQSPAEAMRFNTPLYVRANTRLPYENYPSSYSKLVPGKTYAWQVTAKNGMNYAATTDVWTFSIAEDTAKAEVVTANYILLKNTRDGGVSYLTDNKLAVKYYSFDWAHETVVRFYTKGRKLVHEQKQKIIYGDNFISFKLGKRFHKGEVYFLEITDLKNNMYTTSFSLK